MKKIHLFLALFIFSTLSAQFPSDVKSMKFDLDYRLKSTVNKPMPVFDISSIDSTQFTNDDLIGKVTFFNFWFQECAPCMAEMDALNDLYSRFKNENDFQFISISRDLREIAVENISKLSIQYPVCCVDDKLIKTLNFSFGYPTTITTNREGKIIFVKSGGHTDKQKAKESVMQFEEIIEKELKNRDDMLLGDGGFPGENHIDLANPAEFSESDEFQMTNPTISLLGEVNGIKNGTAYIKTYDENIVYRYDTVKIADGQFLYLDTIKEPKLIRISIDDLKGSYFWIEPGNLNVKFDVDKNQQLQNNLTGSRTNDENEELKLQLKDKAIDEREQIIKNFIYTHPDSYVAAYQLFLLVSRNELTINEGSELFKQLSEQIRSSKSGKEIESILLGNK